MAKKHIIASKQERNTPVSKRTSQGLSNRPKNKHARKNWKKYNRQGQSSC